MNRAAVPATAARHYRGTIAKTHFFPPVKITQYHFQIGHYRLVTVVTYLQVAAAMYMYPRVLSYRNSGNSRWRSSELFQFSIDKI